MAFKKGESGNPRGRPKSTATARLRDGIAKHVDEIVGALLEQALGGDVQAAKILLDRVLPPLKPQSEAMVLPVETSLTSQASAIMAAVLNGAIPTDAATQLMSVLANQARIIETSELIQRIEQLEARQ